jgi:hypothetical protein
MIYSKIRNGKAQENKCISRKTIKCSQNYPSLKRGQKQAKTNMDQR